MIGEWLESQLTVRRLRLRQTARALKRLIPRRVMRLLIPMLQQVMRMMRRASKLLRVLATSAVSLALFFAPVAASVGQPVITIPTLDEVECRSYCVYDKTADDIIMGKLSHDRCYPASMTKIMTAQLGLDYLDTDAYLTVSQNAIDNVTTDSTLMYLIVGEEVKVSELIYGMMLPSGNDAALVLADYVGGGISGLMATLKICEAGGDVDLFSYCPPKRSHSLCAQGGMNACMDTKGEGDTIETHFDDTVYGGDFLADQVAVKGMVEAAPKLIKMFDRMGVPFTRTSEGVLDLRNFGGQKHKRTCFAGSTTGQQILYALDEQVRRWEVKGAVHKYEFWEFIKIIKNKEGICRGLIAQSMNTMEIRAFLADTVILATGGPGQVFGRCTASTICNGSAVSAVYQQGAEIANPEFIQIHPTAIPGSDKNRLMSEACRGEGGRVWVYKDGKPWYFLEEMYPAYGNLVPRDVASRAIYKVCVHMGLGINGENRVYLDLSHIDSGYLERKLGGILEMYSEFVGQDPRKVPMEIFPSVHYSMGGIWVDRVHNTNIPGLMASGECDYQYHGANRLGANSLLSAAYSGTVSGPEAMKWAKTGNKGSDLTAEEIEAARREVQNEYDKILTMNGSENAHKLHHEMGDLMYKYVAIERDNNGLDACLVELKKLLKRWDDIGITDHSAVANQEAMFVRQLRNMILYAMAITKGARMRDESRGAHAKIVLENGRQKHDADGELVFMGRDDEHFMKITIVNYDPKTEEPIVTYRDFDHSLIKPRARNYAVAKKE